jgi:hypothetical protein
MAILALIGTLCQESLVKVAIEGNNRISQVKSFCEASRSIETRASGKLMLCRKVANSSNHESAPNCNLSQPFGVPVGSRNVSLF